MVVGGCRLRSSKWCYLTCSSVLVVSGFRCPLVRVLHSCCLLPRRILSVPVGFSCPSGTSFHVTPWLLAAFCGGGCGCPTCCLVARPMGSPELLGWVCTGECDPQWGRLYVSSVCSVISPFIICHFVSLSRACLRVA